MIAGLDVGPVEVQADSANGEVKFLLAGVAATSVKEARERVRSAIKNSGLEFPARRLTVNLAPAELRKQGSALDLPIAVAIALAGARKKAPPSTAFIGELALDGAVRHVDGVVVAVLGLRNLGFERIFVPAADAVEAARVDGLTVNRHIDAIRRADHQITNGWIRPPAELAPWATLQRSARPRACVQPHSRRRHLRSHHQASGVPCRVRNRRNALDCLEAL